MATNSTPATSAATVLGVYILARHGDIQYDYPNSAYTTEYTSITSLGETQAFNLGALLQSMYLARSSPTVITGLNPTSYVDGQTLIESDDSDTLGSANFASAVAMAQAIWPATNSVNTSLADGGYVIAPLNGYQYVHIDTIDPDSQLYLEGYTDCSMFTATASELAGYPDWLTMAQDNAAFLESLQPYVNGRATTFDEIYDAYSYMLQQYTHNASFYQSTPAQVMAEARALANWHEWNKYSSADPMNILNIAGQTLLPEILTLLSRLSAETDTLKMAVQVTSYQPFISLFQMLGVTQTHPELEGIVNYNGAIALEVRQSSNDTDLWIRFNFMNGTSDSGFQPYPMFGMADGAYDVPLSTFFMSTESYTIPDTLTWCGVCNNTMDRGCDVAVAAALVPQLMADLLNSSSSNNGLSAGVAGVIGACVTLAFMFILLAFLSVAGCLSVHKRGASQRPQSHHRRSSSIPQIVVRTLAKTKRDSGDTESTRGVIKNPGDFEMMPDLPDNISVLSHDPTGHQAPMKV